MAKRFKDTLNLPRTGFPMRANAREREPQLQRICVTELWKWQRAARGPEAPSPAAPFVLHDGPPYANGPLHIGHALNKILKDVINRYKMLRGHRIEISMCRLAKHTIGAHGRGTCVVGWPRLDVARAHVRGT